MKLRYILGMPGSGKSTLCINEIAAAAEAGRHVLYIVPEQFSLESERLLTSKSRNNILLGSEVLSFVHLAHRLLTETGGSAEKILDDNSKVLLLRKVINDLSKNRKFKFYKKSYSRQGFIDNISTLITELIRNSISPDILKDKSERFAEINPGLSDKLNDIALIYSSFNQSLEEHYIAKDALLDVLAQRIPLSGMFKDTDVWIDSFTDFTPQEIKVIEALTQACNSVTISFTIYSHGLQRFNELNAFDPYYEAKRSLNTINQFAALNNIETHTVALDDDRRHISAPDLKFLSENYFSGIKYKKNNSVKCNNIKIYSAISTESELNYLCKEIFFLIRNNNYKYSDIAVMISSDAYYMPLKNIFTRNKIPYFTDIRHDILSHPMTEFIKALFGIIISNNSLNEVIHLLRTGFNDLTCDKISYVENYCIACGINGKKWYEEWTSSLAGTYTEEELTNLNAIRAYIAKILININTLNKNKKYKIIDISKKIYALAKDLQVEDKLNNFIAEAKNNNDEASVRIHTQVWDIIWAVFNRLCDIMGSDEITPLDFYKLVETGFQNITMGLIPPTYDSITIAEFNRSRLPNIKALFMLGVNEGIVPPYHDDTNLLSDNDRSALASEGCEIGGDNLRLINRDRYNIYSYITKPSDKLYLSYNAELESGVPSSLIHDLKSMFAITEDKAEDLTENLVGIYSQEQAFEALIRYLSSLKSPDDKLSPLYESIYRHLVHNGYKERIEQVKSWLTFNDPTKEHISADLAANIFVNSKNEMICGITSIETYNRCPYMYFLQHGLKAYDRKEFDLNIADYGTFLHNVLKNFSDKLSEDNISWNNIDDVYLINTVEEIVKSLSAVYRNEFFHSNKTNEYIGHRLADIAINTIKAFSSNTGKFIPCGYEINFGKDSDRPLELEIGNKYKLVLTGSIDRVDCFKDPVTGETYIKITDYKSRSSDTDIFSMDKMRLGVQLQLPLYMEAYTTGKPDIKPGGFFYFKIDNPVLKTDDKSIYNKLVSGGLAIDNDMVLDALTQEEKDNIDEKSKTAYIKISEEEFDNLIKDINCKITATGHSITNGEFQAAPYKYGNESPCSRCNYTAVCCFELFTGKSNKSAE